MRKRNNGKITTDSAIVEGMKATDEAEVPLARRRGRPPKKNANSITQTIKKSITKTKQSIQKTFTRPLRRSSRLNPAMAVSVSLNSEEDIETINIPVNKSINKEDQQESPVKLQSSEEEEPKPIIASTSHLEVKAPEPIETNTASSSDSHSVPFRTRVLAKPRVRRRRGSKEEPSTIIESAKEFEQSASAQRFSSRHDREIKQEEPGTDELIHRLPSYQRNLTKISTSIESPPMYVSDAVTQFEYESSRKRDTARRAFEEFKHEAEEDLPHTRISKQYNRSSGTDSSGRPPSMIIPSPPASISALQDLNDQEEYRYNSSGSPYSQGRKRSYSFQISVQPPSVAKVNEALYPPPVIRLHIRDMYQNVEVSGEDELNMLIASVSVLDETGTYLLAPPSSEYLSGEWSRTPSLLHDYQPAPFSEENYISSMLTTNGTTEEISAIVSVAPSEYNASPPIANYIHAPPPVPENFLYDSSNLQGSFVMFPNLVLKKKGNYRLKITLFAVDSGLPDAYGRQSGGSWVTDILTKVVRVQEDVTEQPDLSKSRSRWILFLWNQHS